MVFHQPKMSIISKLLKHAETATKVRLGLKKKSTYVSVSA